MSARVVVSLSKSSHHISSKWLCKTLNLLDRCNTMHMCTITGLFCKCQNVNSGSTKNDKVEKFSPIPKCAQEPYAIQGVKKGNSKWQKHGRTAAPE